MNGSAHNSPSQDERQAENYHRRRGILLFSPESNLMAMEKKRKIIGFVTGIVLGITLLCLGSYVANLDSETLKKKNKISISSFLFAFGCIALTASIVIGTDLLVNFCERNKKNGSVKNNYRVEDCSKTSKTANESTKETIPLVTQSKDENIQAKKEEPAIIIHKAQIHLPYLSKSACSMNYTDADQTADNVRLVPSQNPYLSGSLQQISNYNTDNSTNSNNKLLKSFDSSKTNEDYLSTMQCEVNDRDSTATKPSKCSFDVYQPMLAKSKRLSKSSPAVLSAETEDSNTQGNICKRESISAIQISDFNNCGDCDVNFRNDQSNSTENEGKRLIEK